MHSTTQLDFAVALTQLTGKRVWRTQHDNVYRVHLQESRLGVGSLYIVADLTENRTLTLLCDVSEVNPWMDIDENFVLAVRGLCDSFSLTWQPIVLFNDAQDFPDSIIASENAGVADDHYAYENDDAFAYEQQKAIYNTPFCDDFESQSVRHSQITSLLME